MQRLLSGRSTTRVRIFIIGVMFYFHVQGVILLREGNVKISGFRICISVKRCVSHGMFTYLKVFLSAVQIFINLCIHTPAIVLRGTEVV